MASHRLLPGVRALLPAGRPIPEPPPAAGQRHGTGSRLLPATVPRRGKLVFLRSLLASAGVAGSGK